MWAAIFILLCIVAVVYIIKSICEIPQLLRRMAQTEREIADMLRPPHEKRRK